MTEAALHANKRILFYALSISEIISKSRQPLGRRNIFISQQRLLSYLANIHSPVLSQSTEAHFATWYLPPLFWLQSALLQWGSPSHGKFSNVWRHFVTAQAGWGVCSPGIWWNARRDTAKHRTVYRAASSSKELSGPNANNAEVGKPWLQL